MWSKSSKLRSPNCVTEEAGRGSPSPAYTELVTVANPSRLDVKLWYRCWDRRLWYDAENGEKCLLYMAVWPISRGHITRQQGELPVVAQTSLLHRTRQARNCRRRGWHFVSRIWYLRHRSILDSGEPGFYDQNTANKVLGYLKIFELDYAVYGMITRLEAVLSYRWR